jgi:hypothetical protein
MKALAAVVARELRAHAPAGAAALVCAMLPWLAPLLPGVGRQPAVEVRTATAAALALLLGTVLAIFAGAGLLARDLAEGRMGFFLSLPVPAWALWVGRLLAATLLVYGGMTLVMLPVTLDNGRFTWPTEALPGAPGSPLLGPFSLLDRALLALAPLLLLLVAHQLTTALRSRSVWLLTDLAAVVVTVAGMGVALGHLFDAAATIEYGAAASAGAALLFLALLASGGFALAHGGVLAARVHRFQSTFLLASALVAIVLVGAFAWWVTAVDAGDLQRIDAVQAAPRGSWIAVVGNLRHRPSYTPMMLVDVGGNAELRLSPGGPFGGEFPLAFAGDGRRALWLRPEGNPGSSPAEVVEVELGPHPRLRPTGIAVSRSMDATLLPLGEEVAIAEPQRLSLWSRSDGRLLVAASLPRALVSLQELRVATEGRVRLVRLVAIGEEHRLQSWDLDVVGRRLQRLADRPLGSGALYSAAVSADGTRVLTSEWGGRGRAWLLDAASGDSLAVLAPPAAGNFVTARFLPGGGVAVALGAAERLSLRLYDHQGVLRRELALGSGRYAWLGIPWSPAKLPFTASVRVGGPASQRWRGELRELDLASGRVRVLGERLVPAMGATPWWPGDDLVAAGSLGATLFRDRDGRLQRRGPDGVPQNIVPRPG